MSYVAVGLIDTGGVLKGGLDTRTGAVTEPTSAPSGDAPAPSGGSGLMFRPRPTGMLRETPTGAGLVKEIRRVDVAPTVTAPSTPEGGTAVVATTQEAGDTTVSVGIPPWVMAAGALLAAGVAWKALKR